MQLRVRFQPFITFSDRGAAHLGLIRFDGQVASAIAAGTPAVQGREG
jgi:hypothetical protein